VKSLITKVGQTSEGMGASQSTAYKSEIDVKMIDQKDRMMIRLCRPNETAIRKILVGAKVKQCQWVFLELLKMHLLH
jgi:HAE1 family hydrophobic/amphiphilic exporter-1